MARDFSLKIHLNKAAFDQVFGTPDEAGAYEQFQNNNSIQGVSFTGGNGVARNPASPSKADFLCDVDNCLQAVVSEKLLTKFIQHYIMGIDSLSRGQQNGLEQQIGQALRKRKIVPVKGYFISIRRKRKV
jgi:hypothetical protein